VTVRAAPFEVALDRPAAAATEVSATLTLPASEPPRLALAATMRSAVAPAPRFAKPVGVSLALAALPTTVSASWNAAFVIVVLAKVMCLAARVVPARTMPKSRAALL
jgi:hypothetical protein